MHEMRIRFIQTLSTDRQVYHNGHDYEVPDADALRFINAGVARKAPEPSDPPPAPAANLPAGLKQGEAVGKDADTNKADAKPVAVPKAPPAHNPAAFLHGDPTGNAVAEPHTGFTTTEPDARTSPPSDGKSPLAYNHGPEAISNAQTGTPPPSTPAPPTPVSAPKPAAPTGRKGK